MGDILKKFGLFDRYHFSLMILLGFVYATHVAYATNYVFAVENVAYRCTDEKFVNNTCGVVDSSKCSEWIYDKPDSFVAEFQLACQDWKRTLVGTVHSFGNMCGLVMVGPLSDRFGRKTMTIMTGVLGGIFGVAKSFATSYWLYIALEFFESSLGDSCSTLYILNIEIVSTKKRVPYFMFTCMAYAIGAGYKSLIAWLIPDWRNFLRILYGPAILFISYLYLIDESPRWLLIKRKKEEAIHIIEKIAKINKVNIERNILENVQCEVDKEENIELLAVLKTTFRSAALMKRLLICIVWWITLTTVNYGMVITSVSLEGNQYLNFALVSVVAFPANVLTMYLLMKHKRKFPLIGTFFTTGVLCVSQPFLPKNFAWLSVLMFMLGKLMALVFQAMIYMYTSELFPTYTRNSMHALCSAAGRIGSILAPQTPLLMAYWQGLPSLVFGVVAIVAGLVTFLVPDVADISLPDTVKEAEAIGEDRDDKITHDIEVTDVRDITNRGNFNAVTGITNRSYQ